MLKRPLTRAEVASMWLHGERYAQDGRSAIDFYAALTKAEKNVIADFLKELDQAEARSRRK